MTLKTSLLITGDSAVAQKAVDELKGRVEALGVAGKGAAGGVAAVTSAEDAAATAARAMAGAIGETNTAVREMAAAAKMAQAALAGIGAAASGAGGASDGAKRKVREHTDAVNDNDQAARRNAFGLRNLGQQVGDTAVMIQGGIDPMRAFATQAGQMGYALSEMGGKAGAVGAFLTGPWGIALTIAVTSLAPFIEKLFLAGEAADQSAKSYKTAQDAIEALDAATGRANRNKETEIGLIQTATKEKLKEAKATLAEAQARLARDSTPVTGGRAANLGLGGYYDLDKSSAQAAVDKAQKGVDALSLSLAGADIAGSIKKAEIATNASTAAMERYRASIANVELLLSKTNKTAQDRAKADAAVLDITKVRDAELKAASAAKSPASQAGAIATDAALASATNDVSRAQANLTKVTREANAEWKAGQITRDQAVGQIAAARTELDKARDGVKAHRTEFQEQKKATSEAAAENKRLESTLQGIITKYAAVDDGGKGYLKTLRDIAELTAKGKIDPFQGAILTGSVFDAQKQAQQKATEESANRIFTIDGKTPAQQLREIVDGMDRAAEDSGEAFRDRIAQSAQEFAGAIGTVAGSLQQAIGGKAGAAIGTLGGILQSQIDPTQKQAAAADLAKLQGSISIIAKGVGISEAGALKIGEIGGKAIKGAAEGALANSVFAPIAKGLGVKTSQTGAQIGGAIGGMFGPLGGAIGGIAGSVLGGLLKTTKTGSATIGNVGGQSAITGTGGNSASYQKVASGLAGGVIESLDQVIAQLGGTLGDYSVSIGQRKKKFVVDGSGSGKTKGAGTTSYGSAEEAQAGALANAIADGAIQGLSSAVQRAIKSSSDVNAALKEAVKVQNVEMIAKGLAGQFEKAFSDLENTAKDRVRIAREYGLDVVAIEKRNADDRIKLTEQLVKAQAGSLQSLITDLTSGDLFEGSALDKISALDGRIAKAKTDMDAGVEGASDGLADLFRQKLASERDAYGTTAQYAASRNSTIAEAQAAIAKVNAQVNAAKSDPALVVTNVSLDENNSQNAEMISALNAIARRLAEGGSTVAGSGAGFDLASLALG